MTLEEVKENLCCNDKRSPYNFHRDDFSPEDCSCDACFYGKHELACYILELLENKSGRGGLDEMKKAVSEQ